MRAESRNHFIGKTTCGNLLLSRMLRLIVTVLTFIECFGLYIWPVLHGVKKYIKEPALDRRPFRQVQKIFETFFLNAKRFKACAGGT